MKRPKPSKIKISERQAKALAAANRRAYLKLVITLVLGIPLFIMSISVIPTRSPKDMVKAQMVRLKTNEPVNRPDRDQPKGLSAINRQDQQSGAKYSPVGFDVLSSFRFVVTDQMLNPSSNPTNGSSGIIDQIPNPVKELDEKAIALRGFMLPVKLTGPLTTDFLLLRNQGLCCYGVTPKITEWVNVHMKGKGIKPALDQPITICGTLHVGEIRENGNLVGIYRLDGERTGGMGE